MKRIIRIFFHVEYNAAIHFNIGILIMISILYGMF